MPAAPAGVRITGLPTHYGKLDYTLTLPAKKFFEIVKSLPETDIRIAEDKNGVKVAADRFDSRMQTLPREDFPTLPDSTGTVSATLPRDVLRQMVSKTQFAITGEDTRYFLNGALFILRPDSMSLVSTDGHRLARVTGLLVVLLDLREQEQRSEEAEEDQRHRHRGGGEFADLRGRSQG